MTAMSEIGWIGLDGPAPVPEVHGEKAALLAAAAKAGLKVPPGYVLPPSYDGDLRQPTAKLEAAASSRLGCAQTPLMVAVRPSAPSSAGGTAPAILNIGIGSKTLPSFQSKLGERTGLDLYRRLIHSYGAGALGLEGEEFEYALHDALRLSGADDETQLDAAQLSSLAETCLNLIAVETDQPFPQDAWTQLQGAVAALPGAWAGQRARLRRQAMGLDPDAPMALIVQEMVIGLGTPPSGAGFAELREEATGLPHLTGRYLPEAQGEDALMGMRTPMVLTTEERDALGLHGEALEEAAPGIMPALQIAGSTLEKAIGDAVSLEFTVSGGELYILEVKRARRSAKAAVQIVVDLADDGAITRKDALLKIDPAHLEEQLHPAIDPDAPRDLIGQGLPASPGAASGPLVFSPDAAEASASRGGAAILASIETSPEDIRGMHAAGGVLTVRGGMTSHAAVVARGLGKPCIVGARDLILDRDQGTLTAADGRRFNEGDIITVDGTTGQVLAGEVATIQPETSGAFSTLMEWADAERRLGVRANADTAVDASTANGFRAQGIGLCRTEHMFFQHGRITAMREMILAESLEARRAALATLLPMQRADFVELFKSMPGKPVTIRLLDPPLHEFLPHGEAELREMAAQMGVPVAKVAARAAELAEFNPMLGKRGCRIGIAYPEIYEMQARAIFEAAIEAGSETGRPVQPEIMIPLISAVRELEVLRNHIDRIAAIVRELNGGMVDYTVGVMIETPRACLRASEIAARAGFLSFGTNDLTQMLYGLSRDDAGRFMPDYVAQGVFGHDPFHSLDVDGVGEIVKIAIERARAAHPGISLGLCGEHGGDPASVDFCERAGLDYVSCSPFRVPVARLAAAQATLRVYRDA
ncbi:MAG: pyruvate, phosphate dikinase [Pseudomonadota bacterium]